MKLEDFQNRHTGQSCYIVGKGPSLDRIAQVRSHLNQGVVFACNQAIHAVEGLDLTSQVYCVQQDCELEYQCVPKKPTTVHFMPDFQIPGGQRFLGRMKVEESHYNPDAVLYSHRSFCSPSQLTAVAALKLAQYMGIKTTTFFAFDSWDQKTGHTEQQHAEYAGCLGTSQITHNRDHGLSRHHANGGNIRYYAAQWMDSVNVMRVGPCDEVAMEKLK